MKTTFNRRRDVLRDPDVTRVVRNHAVVTVAVAEEEDVEEDEAATRATTASPTTPIQDTPKTSSSRKATRMVTVSTRSHPRAGNHHRLDKVGLHVALLPRLLDTITRMLLVARASNLMASRDHTTRRRRNIRHNTSSTMAVGAVTEMVDHHRHLGITGTSLSFRGRERAERKPICIDRMDKKCRVCRN